MNKKTIVIKLGTSLLTSGSNNLNLAQMIDIVRQCDFLHRQGYKIILVSSGAMACGREHLVGLNLAPTIANKQLYAAVGQAKIIEIWSRLFAIYKLNIGQMLLTRADLENRERFLNAKDLLMAMLENNIIPVINENDAVATSEIKVGDNDNLSALVAILAQADKLILLTDQQGLFDCDPRENPQAKIIDTVDEIDDYIYKIAGGSKTNLGTGGMATKIIAADKATKSGIDVVIAKGDLADVIIKVADNKQVGSLFKAKKEVLEARKQWLFASKAHASIEIDSGAEHALLHKNTSLLSAGISQINGEFKRGDLIEVLNQKQKPLAIGISRYDSKDLAKIKGHKSESYHEILGYSNGASVIHRDDLIIK